MNIYEFREFQKAIDQNDAGRVKELLRYTTNLNTAVDEQSDSGTPLIHAIKVHANQKREDDLEIIKLLVLNGANVNALNFKKTMSPILVAAVYGDYFAVKFLYENGADLEPFKGKGLNALDSARIRGNKEVIFYLEKFFK